MAVIIMADILFHECPKCGDEIEEGQNFCQNCGEPLEWKEEE